MPTLMIPPSVFSGRCEADCTALVKPAADCPVAVAESNSVLKASNGSVVIFDICGMVSIQ